MFGKVLGIIVLTGSLLGIVYLLFLAYQKAWGKTDVRFLENNLTLSRLSAWISDSLPRSRTNLSDLLPSSLSGFSQFEDETNDDFELQRPSTEDISTVSSRVTQQPAPSLNLGLASTPVTYSQLKKIVDKNESEPALTNSFSNPLFETPELLLKSSSLPQTKAEANLYTEARSVKPQLKKLESSSFENPMYDFMVDIAGEAAKFAEDEPAVDHVKESVDVKEEVDETIEASGIFESDENPLIDIVEINDDETSASQLSSTIEIVDDANTTGEETEVQTRKEATTVEVKPEVDDEKTTEIVEASVGSEEASVGSEENSEPECLISIN